MSRLLRFAK